MKPQYIGITKDGNKFYYSDKAMTIPHREDGPACEYVDGSKLWYLNGKCHREDGPAMEPQYIEITKDGNKFYYSDKAMTKCHRVDGPAIDPVNGNKEWYLHGIKLTEREHNMFIQLDQ